jgi:hypothetical protein
MKQIDRRGFARGILFGVAAAGLALTPIAATAMPLDAPGALDDWIRKAEAVVVRPPAPPPLPPRPALLVESRPPRLRLALGLI